MSNRPHALLNLILDSCDLCLMMIVRLVWFNHPAILDPISIVNMNDWCQSSGIADVFTYWRLFLFHIMNLAESNRLEPLGPLCLKLYCLFPNQCAVPLVHRESGSFRCWFVSFLAMMRGSSAEQEPRNRIILFSNWEEGIEQRIRMRERGK